MDIRVIRRLRCKIIGHDIWWPDRVERWAGERECCKHCWYDGHDMEYLEDDVTMPILLNRLYGWMAEKEWRWWDAIDDWIIDRFNSRLPSWWRY